MRAIECDDHALALEIDFYVLHAGNFLQHRSQLAHTLIAFFAFGRDFDRFQNCVIAPFREKWIGRIGISWVVQGPSRLSLFDLTCADRRGGCLVKVAASVLNRPSKAGASVDRSLPVATSRATGSSTRQTFSARIFWPAAFG